MTGEESQLERLLHQVNDAIHAGQLAAALRYADAAHRRAPESVTVLRLLGDVLTRCGFADQAIDKLRGAGRLQHPDTEAALIDALMAAARLDEAYEHLGASLRTFAVGRADRLARTARKAVQLGTEVFGWVGVSPEFEIWGECLAGISPDLLRCRLSKAEFSGLKSPIEESDTAMWRFVVPRNAVLDGTLDVSLDGEALLGSGGTYPPDFGLDGRARLEGGQVRGWVRLGWRPDSAPEVVLVDGQGRPGGGAVCAEPDPPSHRYRYSLDARLMGLHARDLAVMVRLPDGRLEKLPDGPIVVDPAFRPPPAVKVHFIERFRERLLRRRRSEKIDVIVPLHPGTDDILARLDGLFAETGAATEFVVVSDETCGPELSQALKDLARRGRIVLLTSAERLGRSEMINRGLALHGDRDVVVLDPNVQLFPGWLETLRAAARDGSGIGIVSPLTNAGSFARYPAEGGVVDAAVGSEIARLSAKACRGSVVEAPLDSGICLFIRRDCRRATGLFDARGFPEGMGAERDFCQRALQVGWRHVISADVFVRYGPSGPLDIRRQAQLERNLTLVEQRYPGLDATIKEAGLTDLLAPVRRAIDEAFVRECGGRFVVLISLNLPGGVERFIEERSRQLNADGFHVLIWRPEEVGSGIRLEFLGQPLINDLVYEGPQAFDALFGLLEEIDLASIEFHHFLGSDPQLIERLLGLAPYDAYVHDYLWICSRITLLGAGKRYCGEPRLPACESCGIELGGSLEPGLTIRALRLRSARWLQGARQVVAPSNDVAVRLQRYFPDLEIQVQSWEEGITARPKPIREADAILRVALIGAIGDHKGYQVLLKCAQDAAARDLPVEFVVIGFTENDEALFETGRVFITGKYQESEIDELINREAPDFGFFPAVWPETWCYALTHALRAGLDVVAFDLGAVGERLWATLGNHRLLPLETDACEINDCILSMAEAPMIAGSAAFADGVKAEESIFDVVTTDPYEIAPAVDLNYIAPFPLDDLGPTMQKAENPLTVSVEVLPLNKGIYQFIVQSAAPKRVGDEGELVLPAIHVGPGPGVSPEQLEIMTGLRNEGSWLYEPRDILIMKVKTSPTLVLLTSLRTEGMAPLDIAIERIDNKKQQTSGPAPAPAAPVLTGPTAAQAVARAQGDGSAPRKDQQGRNILRTQIMTHIKYKGDLTVVDSFWAGALGEQLAIEAFSVIPLEGVSPDQIEYKGLTATGVETPWISGGGVCGTRGMEVPLIGFAIRLKSGADRDYDCEYRGAFRSGKIVGPLTNGAPCRALAQEDYLEGIQLSIVERRKAVPSAGASEAASNAATQPAPKARKLGPKFSVFREEVE